MPSELKLVALSCLAVENDSFAASSTTKKNGSLFLARCRSEKETFAAVQDKTKIANWAFTHSARSDTAIDTACCTATENWLSFRWA